jgi:hypothetical protein
MLRTGLLLRFRYILDPEVYLLQGTPPCPLAVGSFSMSGQTHHPSDHLRGMSEFPIISSWIPVSVMSTPHLPREYQQLSLTRQIVHIPALDCGASALCSIPQLWIRAYHRKGN